MGTIRSGARIRYLGAYLGEGLGELSSGQRYRDESNYGDQGDEKSPLDEGGTMIFIQKSDHRQFQQISCFRVESLRSHLEVDHGSIDP